MGLLACAGDSGEDDAGADLSEKRSDLAMEDGQLRERAENDQLEEMENGQAKEMENGQLKETKEVELTERECPGQGDGE